MPRPLTHRGIYKELHYDIFKNKKLKCLFFLIFKLIAKLHSLQMLCNEHSLFLEIAQVIRSFNLTILKGVMESCSNNTWAHFIVEVSDSFSSFKHVFGPISGFNNVIFMRLNYTVLQASRGFHRLDIFWPLMQLLQRQRNPISSKI